MTISDVQETPQTNGLTINRLFTSPDTHPYDQVKWETSDIVMTNWRDGKVNFEQRGVEFPQFWSASARQIVTSKYFRGQLNTPEREWSLRQLIDRVIDTYTRHGVSFGYFATDVDADAFNAELKYMLLHQMFAFNSPVWFNVGTKAPQVVSACFLLSVEDTMESILNWYREEGLIFKGGSGAGVNLSNIRGSMELLSSGGRASGPISFMRGADASAGTIKSGGSCLAPWQRVFTAERGAVSVQELAESGQDFTVLSYDPPARRFKAKRARAWLSGRKRLVRVETDKGLFWLSPDHKVRLSDTRGIVSAGELNIGHSLLASTTSLNNSGYLRVWSRDGLKSRPTLHSMVAKDILGWDLEFPIRVVHHLDENKMNNSPSNFELKSQSAHAFEHGVEFARQGTLVLAQQSGQKTRGVCNGMHSSGSFYSDPAKAVQYRAQKSEELMARGNQREMQKSASEMKLLNFAYQLINSGYDISTFEKYVDARWDFRNGSVGLGRARFTEKLRNSIESRFGTYDVFHQELLVRNHLVRSVVSLDGEFDVYDIEVDCPTLDDKSPESGHNFVIWGSDDQFVGSGISVLNSRRAAKLVCLDVNHPDIREFINLKVHEELKISALRDAGFDMDLDGKDMISVQYQNANNSVRVSDDFMYAVEERARFPLRARVDGSVVEWVDAQQLFTEMAQSAWACADPGVQYNDTINSWHTNPNTGPITTSNPCLRKGTELYTSEGWKRIEELVGRTDIKIFDGLGFSSGHVWTTGIKPIVRISTRDGRHVDVTSDHRIYTDIGWVEASQCAGLGVPFDPTVSKRSSSMDVIVSVRDLETSDEVFDFRVETTHLGVANGIVVSNCSEYMSLDDSSCNLSSLNLLKFLIDDGQFDIKSFTHAVELITTAMDISVSFADFPTEKITETSRAYRQLGLGYCNLGALLMSTGKAYDSDEGRSLAGAVTSLMSAVAYRRSAELAANMGPYDGYAHNSDAHLAVVERHFDASLKIKCVDYDEDIYDFANSEWGTAIDIGTRVGYRNSQLSLMAPTGTIAFFMDADTTGIEPDFSLVKHKKLVGGGSLEIVNQCVPRALKSLGYGPSDISVIVDYIAEHGHVIDAPGMDPQHYSVFDCAVGERSIAPMGHVHMMAAVQPYLSGAISKSINMPESCTVADIEDVYWQGWKLGLKSLAVYRDNCKSGQPLSTKKKDTISKVVVPVRRRLPTRRPSVTTSVEVGGAEAYLTASRYTDDTLEAQGIGEIFLKLGKQGSTLAGVMDAFAIAISIALQYGVPLSTFVDKFTGMQFEPRGMTNDSEIPLATSLLDYVFRRLALDYLSPEQRVALGVFSAADRTASLEVSTNVPSPTPPSSSRFEVNAPLCHSCGIYMTRAGVCFACSSCGTTSGCS